jgi:hypothetical protein
MVVWGSSEMERNGAGRMTETKIYPKLPEWETQPEIPQGYIQLAYGEQMMAGDKVWHLWGIHENDWCTMEVAPEYPVGKYEIVIREFD